MSDMLEKISTRTWPLALTATILIAGLMYYLYAASSRIETQVVAADTTDLPRVAVADFSIDPQQYARRRVLVTPVRVVTKLGRATLALDVPGRPGYPAILDRPVLEGDLEPIAGDNLTIAGWVFALNDSILDVWAQRGLYEIENRESLRGHDTFFLVDSLDLVFEQSGAPSGSN